MSLPASMRPSATSTYCQKSVYVRATRDAAGERGELREAAQARRRDVRVLERARRSRRGSARRRGTRLRRAPPTSGGRAPAPTRRRRRSRRRARARSASPRSAARARTASSRRSGRATSGRPPSSTPNSSPATASPRSRRCRARSACSTARSASVTGVTSAFVSTREVERAVVPHRERVRLVGERERELEIAHP